MFSFIFGLFFFHVNSKPVSGLGVYLGNFGGRFFLICVRSGALPSSWVSFPRPGILLEEEFFTLEDFEVIPYPNSRKNHGFFLSDTAPPPLHESLVLSCCSGLPSLLTPGI